MAKQKPVPADHRRDLVKLIQKTARTHDVHRIFEDFLAMGAIAISNRVDLTQAEAREAEYMRIIKRYDRLEDRQAFAQMLGMLTLELDRNPEDVLGSVFHELELHNEYRGQFFTPWSVAYMMAEMTTGTPDQFAAMTKPHDFMTACEPACGAGVMILALAESLKRKGLNYQQQLHVTAVDIDPKCVHMAYLQCSLLGIPAVIHLGDSLRMEFSQTWYTPAHILGGWTWKLRRRGIDEKNAAWWREATMANRIDFLQSHDLDIAHCASDEADRAVLDVRYAEPVRETA